MNTSAPSSVTATRSSIRTPSSPGQVDAGLHAHHVAGRQLAVGLLGEPGLLVHLQPHAVPEAVAEALAVARPPRSCRAPPRRRPGASAPARTARERLRLSVAHQLVDLRGRLGRAARWRSCACSPSSSRRAARPSRSPPARRGGSRRRAARRAGSAPCAPAATIAGKDGSSAAGRAHRALEVQRHLRSVRPARPRSSTSLQRRGGKLGRRARWPPARLVLDLAQPLHERRRRPPARRPPPPSRASLAWVRTLMWASSKPARPCRRSARSPASSRPAGSRSKSAHLLARPARRSGSR